MTELSTGFLKLGVATLSSRLAQLTARESFSYGPQTAYTLNQFKTSVGLEDSKKNLGPP